jgi:hypothetical protein
MGIGDRVAGLGSMGGRYRGQGDRSTGIGLTGVSDAPGHEKAEREKEEEVDMDMGQGYIDTKQEQNVDRGS